MKKHESFAECLQRLLNGAELSASKVSHLVGFRSRNSIFRILNGETSVEVDARFLQALHEALGDSWPQAAWDELEEALEIKRVGLAQYQGDQAFLQGMLSEAAPQHYIVEHSEAGEPREQPLDALLQELCAAGRVSVVICGCYDRSLATLLANSLNDAGADGRLTVRHYIDVNADGVVGRLMSTLPLLSKSWYNARLVDEAQCPAEMMAFYRVNMICLMAETDSGRQLWHELLQCDRERFICQTTQGGMNSIVEVLDRCRFQLEMLKPRIIDDGGSQSFVAYTQAYAQLERDCMILSVKPDLHFNLVPVDLLYQAIHDGFSQSGMVADDGLSELMTALYQIHEGRVRNMHEKHRPTHIVYSLQAMERFVETGVQSDHFFIQRAYTVQERRVILRSLLCLMEQNPYFNIYFMRPELPEIRCEISLYEGRGVLMMDAYTSYDLHDDHSEALITLPGFQVRFQNFFLDVLLNRMVLSRQESIACMERLLAKLK